MVACYDHTVALLAGNVNRNKKSFKAPRRPQFVASFIGVTEFGHSDFLLPFVNFLMLMHRNVQLLLFGNLYAEKLVPYYIQEGYL